MVHSFHCHTQGSLFGKKTLIAHALALTTRLTSTDSQQSALHWFSRHEPRPAETCSRLTHLLSSSNEVRQSVGRPGWAGRGAGGRAAGRSAAKCRSAWLGWAGPGSAGPAQGSAAQRRAGDSSLTNLHKGGVVAALQTIANARCPCTRTTLNLASLNTCYRAGSVAEGAWRGEVSAAQPR